MKLDETSQFLGHLPAGRAAVAGIPAVPRRADRHDRGGELLRLQHDLDHPGVPAAELRGAAALAGYLADLSADAAVLPHHLGADAADRLHHRLLSRLLRPLADLADGAVPGLHHPVLDLEHHPHDLLDSVPRPQRADELRAPAYRHDPRAARVPAVL